VRTLVEYAFRYLNFRKVSLEVLADDERAVAAYTKAGFMEEGRFREHNWHDGAYRDVLRMAVFRRLRRRWLAEILLAICRRRRPCWTPC
jgi:diamine N-acetyltransferase